MSFKSDSGNIRPSQLLFMSCENKCIALRSCMGSARVWIVAKTLPEFSDHSSH